MPDRLKGIAPARRLDPRTLADAGPDGRLVDVVYTALHALEDTPVLKLSRRVIAIEVTDAVWTWLGEGDEAPPSESG